MFCMDTFIDWIEELIVRMIGTDRVDEIEAFAMEQFTTERDNGDVIR